MQRFDTQRSSSRQSAGFTLIELLVVIVIIGVILTLATLSMSMVSGNREVKWVATELQEGIIAAEQQAILTPQILALQMTQQGYEFSRYTRDKNGVQWKPLPRDLLSHAKIFATHKVKARITQLDRNASLIDLDHAKSKRIIIFDSGEVMPFTIVLTDLNNSDTYQLKMSAAGTLTLKKITGSHHHEK